MLEFEQTNEPREVVLIRDMGIKGSVVGKIRKVTIDSKGNEKFLCVELNSVTDSDEHRQIADKLDELNHVN